jgi:hypothetical protein
MIISENMYFFFKENMKLCFGFILDSMPSTGDKSHGFGGRIPENIL